MYEQQLELALHPTQSMQYGSTHQELGSLVIAHIVRDNHLHCPQYVTVPVIAFGCMAPALLLLQVTQMQKAYVHLVD